jgi:hypothetical protein
VLDTDSSQTIKESPMIKPGFAQIFWLLPALLICPGIASAEPPAQEVRHYPAEALVVPQQATELRIYKQGFDVEANVLCRIPKKGPSYCNVNIGAEIANQVESEMILKYTSIRLDEQEFATEVTPQGMLQFRTNKIDYSGPQIFEIEIIYLK